MKDHNNHIAIQYFTGVSTPVYVLTAVIFKVAFNIYIFQTTAFKKSSEVKSATFVFEMCCVIRF